MLLRERHELLVEVEIGDVRGRVRRIADHHRDRLRDRVGDGALEDREKLRRRIGRHRADHAAGHQEAEGVDRIARVGHQHDVARRGDRLRDVGEAFLGAERGDDLGVGIELHAEAARVIGGLRAAQAGDALGRRIAVGARLAERLLHLLDDVSRRRQVRIAHAEIDDVGAGVAGHRLGAIDRFEHVGRQTLDAVEFFHRRSLEKFRDLRTSLEAQPCSTLSAGPSRSRPGWRPERRSCAGAFGVLAFSAWRRRQTVCCSSRAVTRSRSICACSVLVSVTLLRGGGMSWTAGKATGWAVRSGASAGRPTPGSAAAVSRNFSEIDAATGKPDRRNDRRP